MRNVYIIMCLALALTAVAPAYGQSRRAAKTSASAEVLTVTGTVVDTEGEPIIGASVVLVSNPRLGVATDVDGHFSIRCSQGDRLRVSYIGCITQVVSNLDHPRIVMQEDANSLDDVVVVGYGALKQKNVTGAVETINPIELQDLSVSNLSEALAAVSPSIHVDLPGSGRPGETATITIRQAKSAVALAPTGNDRSGHAVGGDANPRPLYVIDEFISNEEEFNNLDIDEVESISILKDAAAAIYGAYGAYGVILVKTKRGQTGKPKISYRAQLGYIDAIRHPDMLSGYDYGRIYNAARAAKTGRPSVDNNVDPLMHYFQADELEAMRDINYNLLDDYWSASLSQRHSINLNGGTEAASYFASVSYFTQDGNIGKLDYDRWNYRAGINARVSKYFRANLAISGNYGKRDSHMASVGGSGSNEDYRRLLKNPAYVPDQVAGYPIYHSGMENDPSFSNYYNYKSLLDSRNNSEKMTNSMTIQGVLEHDFGWWAPLKGLTAKVTYSKNIDNSKTNNIRMENVVYRVKNRGGSGRHLYVTDPSLIIDNDPDVDYDEESLEGFAYTAYENLEQRVLNQDQRSYIGRTMDRADSYQLNFTLNYSRKFGDHNVGALFSMERGESESEYSEASGTHPLPFTDGQSTSLADDSEKTVDWNRSESGSLSYIYRFNYFYRDRYLLEFLMRQQASTKFAPENYWGAFPSVSAGWVISEEEWFDKERTHLDFLKMRMSYGKMGRDNVTAWLWKQLYEYNEYGGALFGTDYTKLSSRSFQLPEKTATNRDLHWDLFHKFNLGFDVRALDDRLSLMWDTYFDMSREGFDYPSTALLPGTVGIYPAPQNYSKMNMWGTEIEVGWRQRIGRDLHLTMKLGASYDDNRVLRRYMPANPTFGTIVEGKRSDRGLWGLSCIGMFRSQIEIDEYFDRYGITEYLGKERSEIQPGMLIYEDIRGPKDDDGNWTAPDGKIKDDEDLVCLSRRADNPYNCNLYCNVQWRNMTLYFTIQSEWGAYKMMQSSLTGESFDNMETENISKLWRNMYVYEDAYDASGNQIVWANRDGDMPNIRYSSFNNKTSTFWRIPATSVEMRNITFAYQLPKRWISRAGMSSVRLNATCQNAFSLYNPYRKHVWSDFAGTYGNYPKVRTVNVGVNVTF